MQNTTWKIGALASQTGITVRTLHHYHQTGLLVPSEFTESGHRLYTKSDIARLQQILSLKQMGFSLDDIHDFIENPNYNPILVVQTQLESITKQIKLKEKLRFELEQLRTLLLSNQNIGADKLFKLMEVIQMNGHNYLTPDQVDKMKALNNGFTDEQKSEMQKQWESFISTLKQHTESKTSVNDPAVKELAIYWKNATAGFTGNDPEITKAGERFHTENPNNPLSFGLTPEMYQYLQTAIEKL
jgi:MerR family transcriptional regulator, thiopeptide resistance regulator